MAAKMTGPADPGRGAASADTERAALPARARRRLGVLELVREGSLTKAEAARRLGLSRGRICRLAFAEELRIDAGCPARAYAGRAG